MIVADRVLRTGHFLRGPPRARPTHQRSPDEALHEAQTHRVGGGGRGDGADQCGERVPDRGRAAAHLPESNSEGARDGLRLIGALYDIEEQIRDPRLTGEAKRLHRLTHSKPHVDAFFAWVDRRLQRHGLAPATPFIRALNYVHERRAGLQVFLTDPDVPIDTNHLERALRPIPLGRKNWNFC